MDVETRLSDLENLVNHLSKKIDNIKYYQDADNASERQNINDNTSSTIENNDGLLDVANLSDENNSAIEDLAAIIDDHEARIEALEEKEA